jgi:hypothetical protein
VSVVSFDASSVDRLSSYSLEELSRCLEFSVCESSLGMAEFMINDLCVALRAFDQKLRAHVDALDEKPSTVVAESQQPAAAAATPAAAAGGGNSDKRNDKVNCHDEYICQT